MKSISYRNQNHTPNQTLPNLSMNQNTSELTIPTLELFHPGTQQPTIRFVPQAWNPRNPVQPHNNPAVNKQHVEQLSLSATQQLSKSSRFAMFYKINITQLHNSPRQ
ncbi:hypothetical protein Droror1_Dr00007833 [Drosera rotundifolia]